MNDNLVEISEGAFSHSSASRGKSFSAGAIYTDVYFCLAEGIYSIGVWKDFQSQVRNSGMPYKNDEAAAGVVSQSQNRNSSPSRGCERIPLNSWQRTKKLNHQFAVCVCVERQNIQRNICDLSVRSIN